MSNLNMTTKKCFCCGGEENFTEIVSAQELSRPDLDCRPAAIVRYLLQYEVQRCPYCNYSSDDVSKKIDFDKNILKSEQFFRVDNSLYPELVKSFIFASMIRESIKKNKEAADFMIRACWALDDEGIDTKKERLVAAKLYERVRPTDEIRIVIIDLYRRAKEFEIAKKLIEAAQTKIKDKYLLKVLGLEKKLVDACDSSCHSREEIDDDCEDEKMLTCDTMDDVVRKLFDDDCNEHLFIKVKGDIKEFEQVALLKVNIKGVDRIFAILTCDDLDDDNTVAVFELIGENELEKLDLIDDKEILEKVYDRYYEMLDPNN